MREDERADQPLAEPNLSSGSSARGTFNTFCNLLGAAHFVASRELQAQTWLEGANKGWPWYSELISQIFDDGRIDSFIETEWKDVGLSVDQRASLVLFRDALDKFVDEFPVDVGDDEKRIIDEPRWEAIRQKAAQVVSLHEEWARANCNPREFSIGRHVA